VAHLVAAFDAHSGLIREVVAGPLRTHDMAQTQAIHPGLHAGDLLNGDRGFCSFAHLALLRSQGVEACLRVHHKQIVSFRRHRRSAGAVSRARRKGRPTSRWLASLGTRDPLVEWVKPSRPPAWMSAAEYDALPPTLQLRELRYRVGTSGFRTREITLVTTLLDPVKYSAEELAKLYAARWQVETYLRDLKMTLGLDVLHCQSVDGVMKELWMFVLVYNLVRMVMLEAARRQKVDPQRISFIDAARWLAHAAPDAELPTLVMNPHRPDRVEPRVIKRRMKEFPLMKKPRDKLRQALFRKKPAA